MLPEGGFFIGQTKDRTDTETEVKGEIPLTEVLFV